MLNHDKTRFWDIYQGNVDSTSSQKVVVRW